MRGPLCLSVLTLTLLATPLALATPGHGDALTASTDCTQPAAPTSSVLYGEHAHASIAPGERHYWRYTHDEDATEVHFRIAAAGAQLDVAVAIGDPCQENACTYGVGPGLPVHTFGGGCGSSEPATWTVIVTPTPGTFTLDRATYLLHLSPCGTSASGLVTCGPDAASL